MAIKVREGRMPMDMDCKKLADGTRIPVLGLGTWTMGGSLSPSKSNDKAETEAIQFALELGYTHIDTAEMYGAGHAEELVGKAIQGFDRENLFITTKVMPEHLRYKDVLAAARRSLERLKTDYIDLYLVHIPNPHMPIAETMEAMEYLQDEGLVRCIGVSNFTAAELEEAQNSAAYPITINQIEYNLLTRNRRGHYTAHMESDIIPYCLKHHVLVVAYEPLARGRLATPGPGTLAQIAREYGKSPSQVAINWLITKPGIVTIAKSTNKEHLEENLGALGWRLEEDDLALLDTEFQA
jgi:diketogulonate reductase-like aldo/keto reductase